MEKDGCGIKIENVGWDGMGREYGGRLSKQKKARMGMAVVGSHKRQGVQHVGAGLVQGI